MALLKIITYGDPILAAKAEEIKEIDDYLVRLATDMTETLHKAPGVGLAAPQVNVGKRLIIVDVSVGKDPNQVMAMINPRITDAEGKISKEEGCLSVPEVWENVVRPTKVRVTGYDLSGREIVLEAEDYLARAFCHEIDHLEGKLFIDRLSPLKRKLLAKKLKKMAAGGLDGK